MCGIFGGVKNADVSKIKVLGLLNEDRGTDASGVFDKDEYIKDKGEFRELLRSDLDKLIDNFKGYLVGHTRYATTGKADKKENAHPFVCEKITGVHNGMIRNFEFLKTKYNQKQMECDSEIIFYLLDTKGIDGLKELIGYYTIVWSDTSTPNKLYVLNHECQFAYYREKGNLMYFCSDKYDLETVVDEKKIKELREDILLTIDINTLSIEQTKIKGLKDDVGFNARKSTSDYKSKDYSWHNDYTSGSISHEDYYGKAFPKRTVEEGLDYLIECPECHELMTVNDALKGNCPVCRTMTSGMIYECKECGGIFLCEQVKDYNKCPHCFGSINVEEYRILLEDC